MLHWTLHLERGPSRDGHAAVAVGHKLYSFGGYSNVNYMTQIGVYVFNSVSLRWAKLPPVTTNGRGDWLPPEVPSMRSGHTAVLIEDTIYIWGGVAKHSNLLYVFDVNTHRWSKPNVSGTVPRARYNHSACVLGKAMYIYGGYAHQNGRTNEIQKLDSATMTWTLINTKGTSALASECHSATIFGKRMFVVGGRMDWIEQEYDCIRVFDTETNCWLNQAAPSAKLLPEVRVGHSAFVYNGELYIFGGHHFNQFFNTLWKLNPETFSWRRIEPNGDGPCSWKSKMCCCTVGDRIILFGGGGYTAKDLYILDLNPSLKTLCKLSVVQHGLEQSGLPHDIRWELAVMTDRRKKRSPPPKRPWRRSVQQMTTTAEKQVPGI